MHNFTVDQLIVQLNYSHPSYISSTNMRDGIVVDILNDEIFVSLNGEKLEKRSRYLTKKVPR